MSGHSANRLFATLAVTVTLLLCALVPKALRDATMLLRYNSAQHAGGTIMMKSARQMSDDDDDKVYNVYELEAGKCPYGQTIEPEDCVKIADKHGIKYTNPRTLEEPNTGYPAGCFLKGGDELWGNPASRPESAQCTEDNPCICKAETRKPFVRTARRCPPAKMIEAKDECKSAAVNLKLTFSAFKTKKLKDKWPKGCFMLGQNIWFNQNTKAKGKCSSGRPCLCFDSRTPVSAPVPPPTIEGAYTEQCTSCRSDVVVPKESCYDYTKSLEQFVNNKEPDEMNNLNYPKGCFKIKRTLWYNNADSTASCDQADMKCMCAGGGKEAYEQTSDTCPVAKRLTRCDCKKFADQLGKRYTSTEFMEDGNYPAGCFMLKNTLWINSNTSSTAKCGMVNGERATCICAGLL